MTASEKRDICLAIFRVLEKYEALHTERKGKWIEDGEWYLTRFRCSECGKNVPTMSNYCPDCGARMESDLW